MGGSIPGRRSSRIWATARVAFSCAETIGYEGVACALFFARGGAELHDRRGRAGHCPGCASPCSGARCICSASLCAGPCCAADARSLTAGYVAAKALPDGADASPDVDGNFILGPTHTPAPEATVQAGVPQGTVIEFTMSSADSKIYPGIAREAGTFGMPDPKNPARLLVNDEPPGSVYAGRWRCMFRNNMSPARRRRLSWARMGRIGCCFGCSTT